METRDFLEFFNTHKNPNNEIETWKYTDTGLDCLRVIPIEGYKKFPTMKGWQKYDYSYEELSSNNGNFGVIPGYNHEENGVSLSVVDIDGLYDDNGEKITEITEYLISIVEGLKETQYVTVERSPNGLHLFMWNRTQCNDDHWLSNRLTFPEEMPEGLEGFAGEPLGNAIEIFTRQNRQVVVSNSIVDDGKYEKLGLEPSILGICPPLSSGGVQTQSMPVDDVNDFMRKVFVDAGFGFVEKDDGKVKESHVFSSDDVHVHELKVDEIDEVVELLQEAFTILGGSKHTDVLIPLSNYLSQHITIKDAEKITDKLITLIPFKDNEKFRKDFLREWNDDYRSTIDKTGINTTRQRIQDETDYKTGARWHYRLAKVVDRDYVYMFNSEHRDNTRVCTCLDFHKNMMYNTEFRKNKNGETVCVSYCKNPVRFVITDIIRVQSLVERIKSGFFRGYSSFGKEVLRITIKDSRGSRQNIGFQRESKFFDVKSNSSGLDKKSLNIIQDVLYDFDSKGIAPLIVDEYIPGLYVHPDTGELARSKGTGGLVDVVEDKPSVEGVRGALELMDELYEFYKGDKSKLGAILRYCLTLPLGFIYRNNGLKIPHLYLYGASNTAKTNLSEIGGMFWGNPNEMSVPGSAVNSVYQFGRALQSTANGLIVNECDTIMENTHILEILKNSYDTNYDLRRRYENEKVDGYTSIIFTSNTGVRENDALVKRLQVVMFDVQERMSQDDVKLFNKTFHWVGRNDNDFAKLFPFIGNYIAWYLHENMNILLQDIEDTRDEIIKGLEEYTEVQLPWLYNRYESQMTVEDVDTNITEEIRDVIVAEVSRALDQGLSNQIANEKLKTNGSFSVQEPPTIYEAVKYKAIYGRIPYIAWDEENDKVVITAQIKKYLKGHPAIATIVGAFGKTLTSPRLKTKDNPAGKKYDKVIKFTENEFKQYIEKTLYV